MNLSCSSFRPALFLCLISFSLSPLLSTQGLVGTASHILIVCHNRKCYFALCREIWRPPKPLGRHNHSCRDLVCFLPWCEWDLRTSEYFHLSRLVLCWGCPQMWRGKTDQQAKTWFISMLIGAKSLWPDLCSLTSFRIYGPRLYPYLTTNWEFIWPGPGKR